MVRAGVLLVGAGRWGRNWARDLAARDALAGVVHTGNPVTRDWLAATYPAVPVFTELAPGLAQPGVGAVVIATPIASHVDLARRALAAGKHTLVEKPITRSRAELAELEALAREQHLVLATDLTLYRHPAWGRIRDEAGLRQPIDARFEWRKWGTFDEDIWWNLAYHLVVLAIDLLGDPTAERAEGTQDTAHARLVSHAGTAELTLDRRSTAEAEVRLTAPGWGAQWVRGSEVWSGPAGRIGFRPLSTTATPLEIVRDRFLDAIRGARSWDGDLALAGRAIELTACLRSLATGRL